MNRRYPVAFFVFLMLAAALSAQSRLEMFANLNVTGGPEASYTQELHALGSTLYFTADDGVHGYELWRSEGDQASTRMVADLSPGPASTSIQILPSAGLLLYFGIYRNSGMELWRVDSSDRPQKLIQLPPDTTISSSRTREEPGAWWRNILFFTTSDSHTYSMSLWRTEGTSQTTLRLLSSDHLISQLTPAASALFFAADSTTSGTELWRSDGTIAGTRIVKDIAPGKDSSYPDSLLAYNNFVIFSASGRPWRSDGTDSGTVPIGSVNCCVDAAGFAQAGNNGIIFSATNNVKGGELWKIDPFFKVSLLKDIAEGSRSSDPFIIGSTGTLVFFTASTNAHGEELWVTDGTPQGTHLVKDLNPGRESTYFDFERFEFASGKLFFVKDFRLWVTDGTERGTIKLTSDYPVFEDRAVVGNLLYFSAGSLFRTDGTVAGTQQVAVVGIGDGSSGPRDLKVLGSHLFFRAAADTGQGLWRTDGSNAPEFVYPASYGSGEMVRQNATTLILTIGRAIYSLKETSQPQGLTPDFFFISNLFPALGKVFFLAHNFQTQDHLWVTDGTRKGTRRLNVPAPIYGPKPYKGKIYFTNSSSLLATDISDAHTTEIFRFPDESTLRYFTADGGFLELIVARRRTTEIWLSDGTRGGTRKIATSPVLIDRFFVKYPNLFFSSGVSQNGEFWSFDFIKKTFVLLLAQRQDPTFLGYVNNSLIFTADRKLWRTDGTAGGTSIISNEIAYITASARIDDLIYLGGYTDARGAEPWVTDGTAEGTRMLGDIYPATYSSNPEYFTKLGEYIWFSASDGVHGRELWRYKP